MVSRIKSLLENLQLSPSAFADSIGVQRSSLSHILSGRNKPSLDFVIKVLHQYPEVDLYWLITGTNDLKQPQKTAKTTSPASKEKIVQRTGNNDIERIVVLNTDGTFQTYNKSQ
ncbi:MAG: helix-turn-helix domain-containing protein [Flavobacteriaceae bacterium]